MYEAFQNWIYTIIDILAVITFVFAARTAIKVSRKKPTEITLIVRNLIILTAAGFLLWSLAEMDWHYLSAVLGELPFGTFADVLWGAGYVLWIIAFSWLAAYLFAQHKMPYTGMSIILVTVALGIAIAVLITNLLVIKPLDTFSTIIYFGYPILSSVLISLTLILYYFFRKVKTLSAPAAFILLTFSANLLGDFLYSYYSSAGIYGLAGVFSDVFYATAYAFSIMAFYLLSR